MSRWSGKYVIGLTGNIATGKSVVRKMLEHLRAYGIDADALAHRAMAKGAPGYPLIVKTFGEWILDEEGQIDRSRMAKIAFSDPGVLEKLEAIVHPLVAHAVDLLIQRSQHSVVVIEAIKLLESDMVAGCDTIWVVDAPEAVQLARLVDKRSMPEAAARQRVSAQPPQSLKLRAAKIVIRNNGSFDETWDQVQTAWAKLPKPESLCSLRRPRSSPGDHRPPRAAARCRRDRPLHHPRTHGRRRMSRADVMAAFGEKAYFMVERDSKLTGVAGWQVENLVTRIDELYFEPGLPLDQAIPALMEAVETGLRRLTERSQPALPPPYLASTSAPGGRSDTSRRPSPPWGARLAGGRGGVDAARRFAVVQTSARRPGPSSALTTAQEPLVPFCLAASLQVAARFLAGCGAATHRPPARGTCGLPTATAPSALRRDLPGTGQGQGRYGGVRDGYARCAPRRGRAEAMPLARPGRRHPCARAPSRRSTRAARGISPRMPAGSGSGAWCTPAASYHQMRKESRVEARSS